MKYTIGFIVLHYKTSIETIRCVNSILNLEDSDEAIILIIDNASRDGSFEYVKTYFESHQNVIYYENSNNEGYSRANNRAYSFLKTMYNLSYIMILNNDTEIKQKDFIIKLNGMNLLDKYDFIGPDIYAPTLRVHQNPLFTCIPTIEKQEEEINLLKHRLNNIEDAIKTSKKKANIIRIKQYIPTCIISLYKMIREGSNSEYFKYKCEIENPVLVGAGIIITRKYINKCDVIFEPTTDFYYEEMILAERCRQLQFRSLYTPELKIFHFHGASTHKANEDIRKYILFTAGNTIKSFEIYKKYFYEIGEEHGGI